MAGLVPAISLIGGITGTSPVMTNGGESRGETPGRPT